MTKYDNVAIADLRKLEKLSIKEDKAALDLSFLRNCQSLNVFPKFVCFNLPNVSQLDTIAIRKRLLRSATSKRLKEHRKLTIAKEKLIGWLKERLNRLDFYILQKSLCGTIKKNRRKLASVHEKKLQNLTRNTVLPFSADDVVTNLSAYSPTDEELDILRFGLSHTIYPPKVNKSDVYVAFEQIHYLTSKKIKNKNLSGQLASELSHLCHSYVSSYQPSLGDLKKYKVLKNLRKNKDIVLLKPDKGNGVVILDHGDYDLGIQNITQDRSKSKPLSQDPTLQR